MRVAHGVPDDGDAKAMDVEPGPVWLPYTMRRDGNGVAALLRVNGFPQAATREAARYVAGWGRKWSGRRAIARARRRGVAPLLLEDAFLRSVGAGQGVAPLGLLLDPIGVHYDATAPSRLERDIARTDRLSAAERAKAEAALALHQRLWLSKYNPPLTPLPERLAGQRYAIVVDQRRGDLAIAHGGVDEGTFETMLREALASDAETIVIRTQAAGLSRPSPLARLLGRIPGHLAPWQVERMGVADRRLVFDTATHPAILVRHADRVYAATSLMGFEARLAGVPTEVFGLPFYAGWGTPGDRQSSPRRSVKRDLLEIFASAYLRVPSHRAPDGNGPADFETVARHLAAKRDEPV